MKFLIVFSLCVAASSAASVITPVAVTDEAAEIQQILDAINHPSTDPATAALLEEMLQEILGVPKPIIVGPAIVDGEYEPISVGPAIVGGEYEPISVGPAIVGGEYEPISVGPAIVGGEYEPISVGPAIVGGEYEPIAVGPAIVEGDYEPISVGPAIVDEIAPAPVMPTPVNSPLVQIIINVKPGLVGNPVTVEGIEPTPVIVAPSPVPEIEPTPVVVAPEPVIVAPIVPPSPVVVLPGILN